MDKVGGGEFEVEVDTSTSQPHGHFNWQELYERLFKAYEAQKKQLRLCDLDQFSTAAELDITERRWKQEIARVELLRRKLAALKEQYRVLEDELLVLGDERNEAVAALKLAANLLSREHPYYCEMNEAEMVAYLIRMPKEMK